MVKLGEQLKAKQLEDQEGKLTRTQRVEIKQGVERNRKAKIKFDNLKAQAKKIQDTKFKDRVDQEEYQEEVVDWSKVHGRTHWWPGVSIKRRKEYIKNKYKKRGETKTVTRTRDKVVPFTLEDKEGTADNSYKDVYDTLSPDLKQFFDTPEVVLKNKAKSIATTKQKISDKLKSTDQKIAEAKEKHRFKIERVEGYIDKKEKKIKKERNDRKLEHYKDDIDRYEKKIDDYEDDLDEDIAELKGYKQGLRKGNRQLNQNKDVNFRSIEDYAWDVASYEEDKEEAKNDNKRDFYESRDAGNLDEQLKKLKVNDPSYSEYKRSVKDYNKDVAYKNTLIKWSDRVGFENISPQAQAKLNPSIKEWRSNNPSEKLVFDKIGNVAGIESGKLQQSISIGNYGSAIDNLKPIKAPIKNTYDFSTPKNSFNLNDQKQNLNIPLPPPPKNYPYSPKNEIYSSRMGLYGSKSEPSGQATAIWRSPTIKEAKAIKVAQDKGDYWYDSVITGLPAQFVQTLGGMSNKQIGINDLKDSGLLDGGMEVLNPITHYNIFKANYNLKQEVEDITPFMKRYDKEYKEYEAVKVTQAQVDAGKVTDAQITASNKAGMDVNAVVTALESEPSYKSYKKRGKIITVDELVGGSDISKSMQFFYGGTTGGWRMLPYVIPPARIVMGADLTATGIKALSESTGEEKKILGLNVPDYTLPIAQTALGLYVTKSGVKGTMALFGDGGAGAGAGAGAGSVKALSKAGLTRKQILTHTTVAGLGLGVGGYGGYRNWKRSGNIYQAVGSGVGTSGVLFAGAYYKPISKKFDDWQRNLGKKQYYTPKFDQKGFARKAGGGKGKDLEAVYMKRYKGFEFKDTKTWKPFLKGQTKGSFLKRQYRLIDPKVEAKFLGKDDATYWKWIGKKQVRVTESAESFPTDLPKTHKQWFDKTGAIKQYYLPRSALKNILKDNYKASGFSAAGVKWKGTEYGDDVLTNIRKYGKWNFKGQLPKEIKLKGAYQFTSGKGGSPLFFRIGGKEEGVLLKTGGNLPQSPTLYRNFFKGSQVNPGLAEVKGRSSVLNKDLKFYILKNQAMKGNIQLPVGTGKGEVQGVYQFTKRIPIQSNAFFKWGGKKVSIVDQIFAQGGGTNVDKIVAKIAGNRGGGEAVANTNLMKGWGATGSPSYSNINRMAYLPSFSQIGSKSGVSVNPSRVQSVKSLLKASQVSMKSDVKSSVNVSGLSSSSRSPISLPKSSSFSSPVSELSLSKISLPSSVFNLSKIDRPKQPSKVRKRRGVIAGFLLGGKKSKTKRKFKDAEFEKLYLPGFTSRALGLTTDVSEKKLMGKIKQIQTGFEIRRAVKIKKSKGNFKPAKFKMPKDIKVKW